MITPISMLDVLFTLTYVLLKWASFGVIFWYFFISFELHRSAIRLTTSSKLILIIIFGIAINIITNMFLMILYLFNFQTVWTLNITTGMLAILLIYKVYYKKLRFVNKRYLEIVVTIALLILFLRLAPLLGEYTYPGDDPKLYSLISRRIVEEGGLPLSWGVYAKEDWIVEKIHLFMIGFPSLAAEVATATNIPVYKTVALITQIMVWITSLAMYLFLEIITRDARAGALGMFLYGLCIAEPSLLWIKWGGNAELASLPFMILSVALTVIYFKDDIKFGRFLLLLLPVTLSVSIITHPFSFIYYSAAVAAVIMTYIIMRKDCKRLLRHLSILLASVIIAILLDLPILMNMVNEEINVKNYYEPSINPSWTPVFSLNQTFSDAVISFFNRVLAVYGVAGIIFIFIVVFCILKKQLSFLKKYTFVLMFSCFWWFILFFLHENNPNGLWLVKFPLWYRIDSNRTFSITSFPFTVIEAILLLNMLLTLREETLSYIQRKFKKVSIILLILIVIVASLILRQEIASRILIGEDDAILFDIIMSLDINGMFVLPYDAGQWIPAVLGKPVIIPMGVATKHDVLNTYYQKIYPTFSRDPCSPLIAEYFALNNISYVYIGGRRGLSEIYPYVLREDVVNSCRALRLVARSGKAALYKYEVPSVIVYSHLYLEPKLIGSGGSYNISYSENIINITLNNSWVALALNSIEEANTTDYTYIRLAWWTEKNVHLVVEARLKNGSIIRLTEPTSASFFYKFGNGTIDWVYDYYIRIPHNAIQIIFIFGGQGMGKLNRTVTFLKVHIDDR